MSAEAIPIAKFRLGKIVSTPNALNQLTPEDILRAIGRHQAGDWAMWTRMTAGRTNCLCNRAFASFVYHSAAGVKFWLTTEADRSSTTVLMPEDY